MSKQQKTLTFGLCAFVVSLVLSTMPVHALDVTVTDDVVFVIEDAGLSLTILAGSTFDTFTVDDTFFSVTVPTGGTTTVRWLGPNPGKFSNDGSLTECNVVSGNNDLIVSGPKTVTVTPVSAVCGSASGSGSSGSGGGGGGGGSGGASVASATPVATSMPSTVAVAPYQPANARQSSPDINDSMSIAAVHSASRTHCDSGTLIKLPSDNDPRTQDDSAVYFCGRDGRRYVFPTPSTYGTWYEGYESVRVIDAATMASIPLGKNVTFRPGVKMIKIVSDPKVYAVDIHGSLRWVATEAVATRLYGQDWNKMIEDVPDVFFVDYVMSDPIL